MTKGVFDRLRKGKHLFRDERLARLSPQEERILAQVAEGQTNGQIGEDGARRETRSRTTSPASFRSSRSPAGPRPPPYLARRHHPTRG